MKVTIYINNLLMNVDTVEHVVQKITKIVLEHKTTMKMQIE